MAHKAKSSPPTRVILKNYSKMVLFYPLWIFSLIAWLTQAIIERQGGESLSHLAIIWMVIFFINLVAIGFDFSTVKFFVLFLLIIIAILAVILLDVFGIINIFFIWQELRQFFIYSNDTRFYGWVVILLGLTIFLVILQAQTRYIKIEENEVYVKGLTEGKSERFPTLNLQVNMEITDVFEYISLGAQTVTLRINPEKIIKLQTVPFMRKKKKQIDILLSTTAVKEEK